MKGKVLTESRVHLEEVEVLSVIGEHLHGAGGAVVGGLAELDGLLLHLSARDRREETRGRLLHHLLVASLHRALPAREEAG
jgi:hypothetical protein